MRQIKPVQLAFGRIVRPVASPKTAGVPGLGGWHDRSAEGAEWSEVWGGVSPLQLTRGSGEGHELPQRGPGEVPAKTHLWHIFRLQNTSGRQKSAIFAQCNAQN